LSCNDQATIEELSNMTHLSRRNAHPVNRKAALAAALLAGGIVAVPSLHAFADYQSGSPKPDWRGDRANTGQTAQTGPAATPAQVFNAKPVFGGTASGIELGGDGSVLFTISGGQVYSYNADGSKKWQFPASGTTGTYGSDVAAPPSNPVLSSDGADYVGNDNGNLYQLADATGASASIFSAASGAALQQTPKIGPDNSIYLGDLGGNFYRLTPPAPGSGNQATKLYSFAASGSAQPSDSVYPGASAAPFRFYGEAALDAAGNAYVASSDTNPQAATNPRVGTLYKLAPNGSIAAGFTPAGLKGEPVGAVLLAADPGTPGRTLAIVADKFPEVAAFDAATGARVWDFVPANSTGGFFASPALSRDGATVYAVNNSDTLYALNVSNGQPAAGFGTSGQAPLTAGSSSSPVVDAAGNVFLESNDGALLGLSPAGATLFSVARGAGTGGSGSTGPRFFAPAIAPNGTLYAGGNSATVRGFRIAPADQTSTAIARQTSAPTLTTIAQQTQTAVAGQTQTAVAVPTDTQAPVNTLAPGAPTSTPAPGQPTNTPAPTSTPAPGQPTNTPAPTSTPAPGQPTNTFVPGTTPTDTPTHGPALGWSKFRADLHNSGNITATLLGTTPGQVFATKLSPSQYGGALYASPVIGPDDTVYQVDDGGRLNAVRPDGAVAWTSAAVLGQRHVSASFYLDFGSSPAVAADGAIYVGSEGGGIYRFNPADGSNAQIFGSGQYQGGSVAIGPDGTLYAGSIDGAVYAVNRDGSQRYSAHVPCAGSLKPFVQSTPAIDKAGNLYIGFGCAGGLSFTGGVLSLGPTGGQHWAFTYKTPEGALNGAVVGGVVLSPDEGTLYARDSQAFVYALRTGDGSAVWASNPNGAQSLGAASPALAPDGGTLYVSGPNGADSNAVYALNAGNGSVAAAVPAAGGDVEASPAVDAAGHVIVATSNGHVTAFGPGLGSTLFDVSYTGQSNAIFGGPAIGTDGSIYVANRTGYLLGLRAGVAVPTPVPTNTPFTAPTEPPQPSLTAVSTITNSTATPVTGSVPTATLAPAQVTAAAAATRAAATTAARVTPTTIPGAGGKRTPTSTPVALAGNVNITIDVGALTVGDQPRITLRGPAGAKVDFSVRADYLTPTPAPKKGGSGKKAGAGKRAPTQPPKPKATAPAKKKGVPAAVSADGLDSAPSRAASPGDGPAAALSAGVDAAKATPTPRPSAKGGSPATKATPAPKPAAKPAPKPKAPACPVVATIRDRGIFRFSRTIGKSRVDVSCLRIAVVPTRATALRLTFALQVIAGAKRYPARTLKPYTLTRPSSRPQTPPKSRLALPSVVQASVKYFTVTAGGTETVGSFTARGAHVTYRVSYTGGNQTRTITAVADANGNNAVKFRVSYLPLRQVGLAPATIRIDATQGKRRARTLVVPFNVIRPDTVLTLRTLRLRVAKGTLRTGGVQDLMTTSARAARLGYVVSYPRGVSAHYVDNADGSGYATLRFHVQYLPPKGQRVLAKVLVIATQGRIHARVTGQFYVQG